MTEANMSIYNQLRPQKSAFDYFIQGQQARQQYDSNNQLMQQREMEMQQAAQMNPELLAQQQILNNQSRVNLDFDRQNNPERLKQQYTKTAQDALNLLWDERGKPIGYAQLLQDLTSSVNTEERASEEHPLKMDESRASIRSSDASARHSNVQADRVNKLIPGEVVNQTLEGDNIAANTNQVFEGIFTSQQNRRHGEDLHQSNVANAAIEVATNSEILKHMIESNPEILKGLDLDNQSVGQAIAQAEEMHPELLKQIRADIAETKSSTTSRDQQTAFDKLTEEDRKEKIRLDTQLTRLDSMMRATQDPLTLQKLQDDSDLVRAQIGEIDQRVDQQADMGPEELRAQKLVNDGKILENKEALLGDPLRRQKLQQDLNYTDIQMEEMQDRIDLQRDLHDSTVKLAEFNARGKKNEVLEDESQKSVRQRQALAELGLTLAQRNGIEAGTTKEMANNEISQAIALGNIADQAEDLPENERKDYVARQAKALFPDMDSSKLENINLKELVMNKNALEKHKATLTGGLGGKWVPGKTVVSKDANGKYSLETNIINNASGAVKTATTRVAKDGSIVDSQFGNTRQERADIAVDKAGRVQIAKLSGDQQIEYAEVGLEAAESIRNSQRSLDLLSSGVKTGFGGGWITQARQHLGVSSGDEGELSYRLSKEVLSQLKPIFGSQFTNEEGKRLELIEAGLNKSPAANKRVLEMVVATSKRAARRGLRAAKAAGNEFLINEIQSTLDALNVKPTDSGGGKASSGTRIKLSADGSIIK